MGTSKVTPVVFIAIALLPAALRAAPGGAPPSHGFDWAVIGAPGNAPINVTVGYPGVDPVRPIGDVGYAFRIATTEVTQGQWLEFVNAYAPYVDPLVSNSSTFTSNGIVRVGGSYVILQPGAEIFPARVAWRFAARYANWLHNDKALTRDAFENGAYDTSTFGINPSTGALTDQDHRSAGARFFLPTFNEWTKAVFFDPNRYGEGQPGYWMYPNGTDEPLPSGLPQNGGQTMTGYSGPPTYPPLVPPGVGGYPDVRTPWGLLDGSGSAPEWTEDWVSDEFGALYRVGRWVAGSGLGDEVRTDRIGWVRTAGPGSGTVGIRLASIVPAPGGCAFGVLVLTAVLTKRSRG